MGGTPKSSIYRLIFHYKPSTFEDPPSMETSKQMGVPPNHRKFDSFSIETHGFWGSPILRSPQIVMIQTLPSGYLT